MDNTGVQINELRKKIKEPYSPYIEVDEGWFQIVLDCHKELEELDPDYSILQIKEKFGALRYYFQPSNPAVWDQMNKVVAKYEEISSRTCEVTGKPGILMKSIGSWYKTLNPEFAETHMSYAKYKPVSDEKGESDDVQPAPTAD